MATAISRIVVDFAGNDVYYPFYVKQYDSNSRYITVSLINDKVPVVIPSADTVRLNILHKNGNKSSISGAVESTGEATFLLTASDLQDDNALMCSVSIFGAEGSMLTSPSFNIYMQEAEYYDVAPENPPL